MALVVACQTRISTYKRFGRIVSLAQHGALSIAYVNFLVTDRWFSVETDLPSCAAKLETIADKILADHFAEAVEIVDSIHGVGVTTATSIIAEIGPSMDQFQTGDNLTKWSG